MAIFFTSDNHFGHNNIIEYCKRPFSSVDEMNEIMIERWNSRVSSKDTVYHLSDFTLGGRDVAQHFFSMLNGKIIILGNNNHHDKRWLKYNEYYSAHGIVVIAPPIVEINDNYHRIVMCHFPLAEWNGKFRGSYHFHGHSHGNYDNPERCYDVGVDVHNFYPVTFEEIVK